MTIPKKKLSDAELEIMLVLWQAEEPVTASWIQERITQKRKWAMSTLMTVLTRLANKGYLVCDRSTRTNLYSATVEERQYKEQESRSFLQRMYGNSIAGLVSSLYNGGAIDDEDLKELRDFLSQADEEDDR